MDLQSLIKREGRKPQSPVHKELALELNPILNKFLKEQNITSEDEVHEDSTPWSPSASKPQ